MIRFLRGRVAERGNGFVVLDVGGVGFQVFTPDSSVSYLPEPAGGEVILHTRLQVREDALSLYGFATPEEAGLFDLLITVSGVGPKVALGVLSACRPKRFLELVVFEDAEGLARLPGVGKKLSQRLIVELRDRLAPRRETLSAADLAYVPASGEPAEEAIEALTALGYGRVEAAQAVDRARRELGEAVAVADVANLLKRALKNL